MQGIGDTTQARGDIGLRGVPDQVDGGDQVDPVGADPLHVQIADPFDLVVVDEGRSTLFRASGVTASPVRKSMLRPMRKIAIPRTQGFG